MSNSPLLPNVIANPTPPPGGTKLVLQPDELWTGLTDVRETDVRTALTRGVKEYLEQLTIEWVDGNVLRFAKVQQTWAQPENLAVYPSACVYGLTPGDYDEEARLSPKVTTLSNGLSLLEPGELSMEVIVDMWARTPPERVGLCGMLEDAFAPVDWMSGFRLELPHYHNRRATFSMSQSQYLDTPEDAQRLFRRAQFVLKGTVGQVRVLGQKPRMTIKTTFEAL
jgi:hypothetical protein